jgi:hypothetical protein
MALPRAADASGCGSCQRWRSTVVMTAGAYNDPQIRRTVTEILRQIGLRVLVVSHFSELNSV